MYRNVFSFSKAMRQKPRDAGFGQLHLTKRRGAHRKTLAGLFSVLKDMTGNRPAPAEEIVAGRSLRQDRERREHAPLNSAGTAERAREESLVRAVRKTDAGPSEAETRQSRRRHPRALANRKELQKAPVV